MPTSVPNCGSSSREYCPQAYLERFDDFADRHDREQSSLANSSDNEARLAALLSAHPNRQALGHHNVEARLADMDTDGVTAELMWHFSQNGEPLPFAGHGLGTVSPEQFELASVGYKIYNRWLADFCSADPERLLGLIYLPMWDIEAAIAELRWARSAGLRVLEFPAAGPSRRSRVQRSQVGPLLVNVRGTGRCAGDPLQRRSAVQLRGRPGSATAPGVRGWRMAGAALGLVAHLR